MSTVMDQFIVSHPQLPGAVQTHAFIQSQAVQLALATTRSARIAAQTPDLWHDTANRLTTPVIDLGDLHDRSSRWIDLLRYLKPHALGLLRSQGVDESDADDLIAEAMAGTVKPRKDGSAILHDLLVYEQLPPLFLSILRRRILNHIRHRNAEKRLVRSTISLDLDEEWDRLAERSTFATWAANASDPMHGLTLARLAAECAHSLTGLQQRILSTLYIEESASYMELANSAWFSEAVALKPSASEATRRRALDTQHDSALDHLAESLGIDRRKS